MIQHPFHQPQPPIPDRSFSATNLLVVQTFVVQARDGSHYFEVHLAPDAEPGAQRTILHTKDETAYEFALELEGKPARVSASWHHARRGSQRYAVLDSLEVSAS